MKLFEDSETYQKERPTELTDAQKSEFYLTLAKEIIKEEYAIIEPHDNIEEEIQKIVYDLTNLYPFNDNGFQMGKDLEKGKAYYDISVDFCEWLEHIDYKYRKAKEVNEKDWVKAHNIQPTFEKGTKLLINENLNSKLLKGLEVYVNGFTLDRGYYHLNINPDVYGGTLIPYELTEENCTKI